MAKTRLPTAIVEARGKKHFTKAELQERYASEIQPITDNITAPSYLTKKQKDEFYKIVEQLNKLKIMGETDVDTLARYITSHDMYTKAVKQLRKTEVVNNPLAFEKWLNIQDKLFKQCRASANDLGLSISSRCKLVVPEPPKQETKKDNKFSKFEKS